MTFEWYRSLSEIIGPFQNLVEVNRDQIPGADFEPEDDYWWYVIGDTGKTSASPVQQMSGVEMVSNDKDPNSVVKRISEAIQLPGTPEDYYYAINYSVEKLWGLRRNTYWIYSAIEKLSLLVVQLIEKKPKSVDFYIQGSLIDHSPFFKLIKLYREEGYNIEAADIEARAKQLDQEISVSV